MASRASKSDAEVGLEELNQQLTREAERCRDLTSDLHRSQEELMSVREELAEAEEARGALQLENQHLQVKTGKSILSYNFPSVS